MNSYKEIKHLGYPPVISVYWNPQSDRVATANFSGGVNIYDQNMSYILTIQGYIELAMSISWHPDGRKFVCSDRMETDRYDQAPIRQTIRVWDAKSGEELTILNEDPIYLSYYVAWSPDGTKIAGAVSNKLLRIRHGETYKELHTLVGHSHSIHTVLWSSNNNHLATIDFDNIIRIWDSSTGTLIFSVEDITWHSDSVKWNVKGDAILIADQEGNTTLYNISNPVAEYTLEDQPDALEKVEWHSNKTIIAGICSSGSLCVWNGENGKLSWQSDPEIGYVRSIAWHPNEPLIAYSTEDHGLYIWHIYKEEIVYSIDDISHQMENLVWSPDGSKLCAVASYYILQTWDVSNILKALIPSSDDIEQFEWLCSISWSSNGAEIVQWYSSGVLRSTDIETNTSKLLLRIHQDGNPCMAWSPSGLQIALGNSDGKVQIVDIKTNTITHSFDRGMDINNIGWSKDGLTICTIGMRQAPSSTKHFAEIINLSTSAVLTFLHDGFRSQWGNQGRLIAGKSEYNTLQIVNINGDIHEYILPNDESDYTQRIVWSHDDEKIALGYDNGDIYIWDVNEAKLTTILQQHKMPISMIAWKPDGTLLVSGSDDHTACIWDTWDHIATLYHSSVVMDMKWSADENQLAVACLDGTISIWESY